MEGTFAAGLARKDWVISRIQETKPLTFSLFLSLSLFFSSFHSFLTLEFFSLILEEKGESKENEEKAKEKETAVPSPISADSHTLLTLTHPLTYPFTHSLIHFAQPTNAPFISISFSPLSSLLSLLSPLSFLSSLLSPLSSLLSPLWLSFLSRRFLWRNKSTYIGIKFSLFLSLSLSPTLSLSL